MKKTVWTALGMAVVLFAYGYLMSYEGHDHEEQHVSEDETSSGAHEQHSH